MGLSQTSNHISHAQLDSLFGASHITNRAGRFTNEGLRTILETQRLSSLQFQFSPCTYIFKLKLFWAYYCNNLTEPLPSSSHNLFSGNWDLYMSWACFPNWHVAVRCAPQSIMVNIDPLVLSHKHFFHHWHFALRRSDGFILLRNLVKETLLWEMLLLFDYHPSLSLCVSWPFPPHVSSHYTKHVRLEDEGNE